MPCKFLRLLINLLNLTSGYVWRYSFGWCLMSKQKQIIIFFLILNNEKVFKLTLNYLCLRCCNRTANIIVKYTIGSRAWPKFVVVIKYIILLPIITIQFNTCLNYILTSIVLMTLRVATVSNTMSIGTESIVNELGIRRGISIHFSIMIQLLQELEVFTAY